MGDVVVDFRPDMRGIREILHSDGVNAELDGILAEMALEANDGFFDHFPSASVDGYGTAIDNGRYTSLGVVYTQTGLGMIDEARHHTLESLNH